MERASAASSAFSCYCFSSGRKIRGKKMDCRHGFKVAYRPQIAQSVFKAPDPFFAQVRTVESAGGPFLERLLSASEPDGLSSGCFSPPQTCFFTLQPCRL